MTDAPTSTDPTRIDTDLVARWDLTDPAKSAEREWVLALGDGSFAMGTVCSVMTRRYHAILTAALSAPVRRYVMLKWIDEKVTIGCSTWKISPMHFLDREWPATSTAGVVLERFVHSAGLCAWTWGLFSSGEKIATFVRTIEGGDREARVRVTYSCDVDGEVVVTPLLGMRDFHERNHPGTIGGSDLRIDVGGDEVFITRDDGTLALGTDGGFSLNRVDGVWRDFVYARDRERGQGSVEDLYAPFELRGSVGGGSDLVLRARAHGLTGVTDVDAGLVSRRARVSGMSGSALAVCGDGISDDAREAVVALATAADDFVVRREGSNPDGDGSGAMSVIAGYPWFSDWGRDTMIALEGLLLVTGRHEEALRVLLAFAGAMDHGLIPNRFDDAGGSAHYNTVDASLWFVHACARWSGWSGEELPDALIDACWRIVEAYFYGTINSIGVDQSDGLVSAGSASTQLTWMDALRDGVAFTPRHGKAVEINALWIRALRLTSRFVRAHHPERARRLSEHADRALSSMTRLFVRGASGGLVDRLESAMGARGTVFEAIPEVRPNQVFAGSLEGLGFDEGIRRSIVVSVDEALWTAHGVRTLAPGAPGYCGHYTGTMTDRDRAYHNGTAWQWLLGPFHEAAMRAWGFDEGTRGRAIETFVGLARSMGERTIGSIAEICDAEPTDMGDGRAVQEDRGCPAQAWSVAEALRVLVMAVNPSGWAEDGYSL